MRFGFVASALAVAAVAAAGSFIQRVTGFGFGIFVMIFLPHILSVYGEANMLASVMSVFLNVIIVLSVRKKADFRLIVWPVAGFAVLSVPAVLFMKKAPDRILFILLGAVLIAVSVWLVFFSSKVKIKSGALPGLVCGGLSGIMGGLFSMGGPPVVIYFLQSSGDDKERYLGTIQAFFLVSNLYGCSVKAAFGFATADVFILALCGLAGIAAGIFFGGMVFRKLDAAKLRLAVYVFMAVSGILNIATSVFFK